MQQQSEPQYTWTGNFNEDGLPTGKGKLYKNENLIYVGNMTNGKRNDEKAWAYLFNISTKYPGWIGFVGTFANGHHYGPCNIYPEVNNPKSKIEGMMINGKFVEPAYPGSKMVFTEVVKLP